MITPYKHQIEKAEQCWNILKETGYVYLAGAPRSGKTLTSLLIAEKSSKIKSVLILTKKAAIPGWEKFLKGMTLKHQYQVTNYEQVGKWDSTKRKAVLKLNPKDYDLVIIDESHNLGTVGKPSGRYKAIKSLCYNMPHIHLSGTAIVESPNSIYHQMSISKYNPFSEFKNFYDFFRRYGKPYYIKAAGREIAQYGRFKPELLDEINKFTIYMTQEDAGISKDLQAEDVVHYVELDKPTKELYNTLMKDNIAKVYYGLLSGSKVMAPKRNAYGQFIAPRHPDTGEITTNNALWVEPDYYDLVCDTTMKLRTSLHMLESGIAKIDDEYIELGNTEKIDYIMNTFGDSEDVGIMCHFVGERRLLEKKFKKAKIYSSSAHAEGVDLSHLRSFVFLSSDYSGSKFIQRRDRIINVNGSETLQVHHILVKNAISEQVYKRVSKKLDFNNSTYGSKAL